MIWSAIFIGTIVSLGYEILLNFLGIGLGLSSFDLNSDKMLTLGMGAIIWLAISGIISMGIGGYFVGLFSNMDCRFKTCCLAIASWSLATLFTVMLTATAAGIFLGGAASIAKNSIPVMAQTLAHNGLRQEVDLLHNQSAAADMQQTNIEEKANLATAQMGKSAIILFFAFLISGIASVLGAACAPKCNKECKVE
jgi:hypothetical protein